MRGRQQGAAAAAAAAAAGGKNEREREEKSSRSAGEERGEARGRDGPIKVGRLRAQERVVVAQNRTVSTVRSIEAAVIDEGVAGEHEASNGWGQRRSFAGGHGRCRRSTAWEKGAGVKSHAAWRGMLVAKMAAASDTARQWSSFAPQNRRCLHGRRGQPLNALVDAGNEVAEVERSRGTGDGAL